VAVNEPRKGHAVLAIASRVAAPVVPLLVAGAALAVLANSGGTKLPSVAPGSLSPPALPHESVTVSPHAAHKKVSHAHPARHVPLGGTNGGSTGSSGTGTTSPVSRPVTQPRTGGNKPSTTPRSHGGGGTGSGSGGSGSGGGPGGSGGGSSGGSGGSSGGTGSGGGTPTTQPPQYVSVNSGCTHPRGLALGHLKQANGLALGHRNKPCTSPTSVPRGLAVGRKQHVPPGQARKAQNPHGSSGKSRGGDDEQEDEGSNGNGHGNGRGHGG